MESVEPTPNEGSAFDQEIRARLAKVTSFWVEDVEEYPGAASGVLGWTSLLSPGHHTVLLDFGGYFDKGVLRADKVDGQLLVFPPRPSPIAMNAEGSPTQLVAAFEKWVLEIRSREIVVDEWVRRGKVYASATRMERYGDLSYMFNKTLAPRRLEKKLLAKGSFQGRGWVVPRGIGEPTRSRRLELSDLATEPQGADESGAIPPVTQSGGVHYEADSTTHEEM